MSNYHRADTRTQWYQGKYPGAVMHPNVVVLHTTEGGSWPSYSGGAVAPTYTAMPNHQAKRLDWRAHFPDERSARALENHAGGVETNTLNAVQVELVGTCTRGGPGLYWPEAPVWALEDLADFLVDQHLRHGTKLQGPELWLPYPASYGNSRARMSGRQWRGFYGICGHQHVPENHHGDPGALPFAQLLELAKAKASGKAATTLPAPTPDATPGRIEATTDEDVLNMTKDEFRDLLRAELQSFLGDHVTVPEGHPARNDANTTVRVDTALHNVMAAQAELPAIVTKAVAAALEQATVHVDGTVTENTESKGA